jgi:cation diffusion facilitator CzcD-associated flavoprotein CzcO
MTAWNPRVIVIGAGAGGIAAAVRLLQDGIEDLVVIDRDTGVGGVWRENSYPGAQCDVPSHLYSLSFQLKPDWSQRFGNQDEILAYLEDVAQAQGITPYLRLRTEVVSCTWDDAAQLWQVKVRDLASPDGAVSTLAADVVITATGQLSTPAVPQLPGLESFAGPAFHSARWQHDTELAGRRVAVIGTGASAIQFVPPVAEQASHVDVFQRSAPYIIGKPNRRYSRLEQRLYARIPALLRASRLRQYIWHEGLGIPFTIAPPLMAVPTASWRRRMRAEISDPALRQKLTPDYLMGCKRLLRSKDWYQTLARRNVSVVTDQISEVVPEGIRTSDGQVHPADVIIFGTGFAATQFLTPMRVTGPGGKDLHEHWKDGARAYLGTAVAGFPNLFLLYGPGTNLGHSSILFMIESQLTWIRSAIATLREAGPSRITVRPQAQTTYDAWFTKASAGTVWEAGCTSWYTVDGHNTNNWPATTLRFQRLTRSLRRADVEVVPTSPGTPPAQHSTIGEPTAATSIGGGHAPYS